MPSSFQITELTGSRRSVILRDRALPYRPVAWPGEQRYKKTNYSGNTVATVQVLGPNEIDTEIHGTWKTKFIGSMVTLWGFDDLAEEGDAITAEIMDQVFERLRIGGNLIRVTWEGKVRRGILARFEASYMRKEDLEWRATFVWTQIGDAPAPRAAETNSPQSDLETSQANLDDIMAQMPIILLPPVTGPILAAHILMQEASLDLASSMSAIYGVPNVTVEQFRGIAGKTETVNAQGLIILGLISNGSLDSMIATDNVGALLKSQTWRFETAKRTKALMADSIRARESIRGRVISDILGTDTVRTGQTIRDVAITWYGSADSWTVIADANGFTSSIVPAGTILVIPRNSS